MVLELQKYVKVVTRCDYQNEHDVSGIYWLVFLQHRFDVVLYYNERAILYSLGNILPNINVVCLCNLYKVARHYYVMNDMSPEVVLLGKCGYHRAIRTLTKQSQVSMSPLRRPIRGILVLIYTYKYNKFYQYTKYVHLMFRIYCSLL